MKLLLENQVNKPKNQMRNEHVFRKTGVDLSTVTVSQQSLVFNLQKIIVHHKKLWLFGVDRNGYSVSVHVNDFAPTFLIKSPDLWAPDDIDAECELEDFLREICAETTARNLEGEFVRMTPFIGFTNCRKDRMVRIKCRNIHDCTVVTKHLEMRRFTMYHEELRSFTPAIQFLHQTGLEYQTWIDVTSMRYSSPRTTHTSIEGFCSMQHIRRNPDQSMPVPVLKAFIRMKAVSRDALLQSKPEYRCDSRLPCDRLVAIGVHYTWNHDQTDKPCYVFTHTIMGGQSEQEMLTEFRNNLVQMDPDEIYFFPDEFAPWEYFVSRTKSKTALNMERFITLPINVYRKDGEIRMVKFNTRNVMNMELALKKKVFIPVESYDLYTCSAHSAFRKKPEKGLVRDLTQVNKLLHKSPGMIIDVLNMEIQLLLSLELDTSMNNEYSNVSKASDTDLTDVVSRGEQIRVFNRLMHFNVDNHMYVNREQLGRQPLKFDIRKRPPTFVDPAELPLNTNLRNQCLAELAARTPAPARKSKNKPKNTQQTKVVEGGNVLHPACRFWDKQRIAIFDFASLYPSIMMAFQISYENIVYDDDFLDLPGVEYFTVPINAHETVVSANVPGTIPKMLKTFVDNRSRIKAKMKTETDSFRQKTLDFEQNSMKVLCNGTYGFMGADQQGSLLPLKPLMYVVTSIGRYLQKLITTYIGNKYGLPTIYGDTDSIFVLLERLIQPFEHQPIEEMALNVFNTFDMPGKTWQDVCNVFENVDVSTLSKPHQINALCMVVGHKLTKELTDLINRPPVKLEFENLADKMWMSHSKKAYFCRLWSEKNPSKVSKIKITGVAAKKRDWSPWTRRLLFGVMDRILNDKTQEIKDFLTKELDLFVQGSVRVSDLMVTKSFKRRAEYKNFQQPHLQIVLKMEKRARFQLRDNTRVYFVIICGTDKLYNRSETPEYAEEHKLKIDKMYYLERQFFNPMTKLLVYHSDLFDFEQLLKTYMRKVELAARGQREFSFESSEKKQRLE